MGHAVQGRKGVASHGELYCMACSWEGVSIEMMVLVSMSQYEQNNRDCQTVSDAGFGGG